MHISKLTFTLLIVAMTGCGGSSATNKSFSISSTSAVNGRLQNTQFAPAAAGLGCTGGNQSPQVSWDAAPEGTKSFVLTMRDRDAPTGSGFWHWVVADLPAGTSSLAAGALLPTGVLTIANDGGAAGYSGICPPANQTHRYDITVHAMKIDKLASVLPPNASPALVGFMVAANSLGDATLTLLGGSGPEGSGTPEATPAGFVVSSSSVTNGQFANTQFAPAAAGLGCTGGNISPQIAWQGAPAGTKSFAVTMYDPDAQTGSGWWHWVLADISAETKELLAGVGSSAITPTGTLAIRNDGGQTGYGGICPPAGQTHNYAITVHALAVPSLATMLPPNPSPALTGFMINATSLGKATLTVRAGR